MIVWINDSLGVAPCDTEIENGVFRLDVRELVDRRGNDLCVLRTKIEDGTRILREGEKLVVCCDLGVSRSMAIAVGILSLLNSSFDRSIKLVAEKVKDNDVSLEFLEDVRRSVSHTTEKGRREKSGSRILLIGSAGSIGNALVKSLPDRHVVCSFKNEMDLAKNVLSLYSEVRDGEINFIVNLAHSEPRNLTKVLLESVAMTRNILEVSRLNDIPLVFLSSLLVFEGYNDDAGPTLRSDLEPRPTSIYGQSKALCEELIRWYRNLYGLSVTTLRLPNVYGENTGRTTFLMKLMRNASENKAVTVHRYLNGFQRLDLLHVDEVAEAIERAIRVTPSEDINLGSETGISTLDLAKLIVNLTKSNSRINIVNVKDRIRHLIADTTKARELLNWKPKTDFRRALQAMLPSKAGGG